MNPKQPKGATTKKTLEKLKALLAEMETDFVLQLKEFSPHLYQVNSFIVDAKKLGYGEIELTIKTHNYISKMIDVKAVKPKNKTLAKSISKRIVVKPNKK